MIDDIEKDEDYKEYQVGLQRLRIRTQLQYCAILSQVGKYFFQYLVMTRRYWSLFRLVRNSKFSFLMHISK